ncbi:MAG: AAA family ATPase [Bacteroidales bacterium]|nr:AAA family ATPase [Bacteroidales bacterium]
MEVVLNSNVKARESKKLKGISFPPIERFNDYKANPRINIADLGKGATNIIKLVMKTATVINAIRDERSLKEDLPKMQGRKPERVIRKVILVEEPEAFLHPNWQSRLADFFVFCMTKYDIQFIVETHSSYLIQRMQYLVAKKEIDPERINLLYFNKCSEDEKYYKINIRKDGILKENFGTGFYDETANLTAAILNAQNLN